LRVRRLACAAAAGAALLILAGAALGSPPGPTTAGGHGSVRSHPQATPNLVFAGYLINQLGPVATTTTTVAVPKLKCTIAERAIAAGTGIVTRSAHSSAELFVGCVKGKPQYFPVLIVNGHQINYKALEVDVGDRIVLSVGESGRGARASIVDQTQKSIRKTLTGRGARRVGDPWVGDQAWSNSGNAQRVPNFDTLGYSNSKLDGKGLGATGARLERFNRVSPNGKLQIFSGRLARDRESFKTLFKHA
jgi:hypothetical protein